LAVAKLLGCSDKVVYTEPVTFFDKLTNINIEATPRKAEEVLGWHAKYPPTLHSLDVLYAAYLAHKMAEKK